jgi:hypothetical protein
LSHAIPSRGTKVPVSLDWIHEIKQDAYRLIQREALAMAGYALHSSKFNGLYLGSGRQGPDL